MRQVLANETVTTPPTRPLFRPRRVGWGNLVGRRDVGVNALAQLLD